MEEVIAEIEEVKQQIKVIEEIFRNSEEDHWNALAQKDRDCLHEFRGYTYQQLINKKFQLRNEEFQLRNEEFQLRNEEFQLRNEEFQLRNEKKHRNNSGNFVDIIKKHLLLIICFINCLCFYSFSFMIACIRKSQTTYV
jgi:hypothetical protein